MQQDCIFCKIAAKQIPSAQIWEDEKFFAFLDIRPVSSGHTLIIPKDHCSYIYDLPDNLYAGIFQAAKKLYAPLQKVTGAKRIGLVVEGFGVDHVHLHLIPINHHGDIDSKNAHEIDPQYLAKIQNKITDEIKNSF